MTFLDQLDPDALMRLQQTLLAEHSALKARGLRLNIARGKPSREQLDLSNAMLSILRADDCVTAAGDDARNYGGDHQGVFELRELFSPLLGAPPEQIVAGGNSSLSMMHDVITWALLKGIPGSTEPWSRLRDLTFICPAPGYELHHKICEEFGIHLLPVPVTPDGPDMDIVEMLTADQNVKGMWCVPTYANPTGEIYSQDVVARLAAMKTGASDFRLFWDDAYVVHHLGDKPHSTTKILDACLRAGNPDRPFVFSSTSKITFAGAGVGFLAASAANVAWYVDRVRRRGPGPDKLNQLRHVRFLKDADGLRRHMEAHRAILAPKFATLLQAFEHRLKDRGVAQWSCPEGGYFISIETRAGAARRTVALAQEAGVTLTTAGSTWPHGNDPKDSNIRIAPSFASIEDVEVAAEVIALSILLAAIEVLGKKAFCPA
ncbi:aminotransferase class I/II-fold pyridoxal phosphate-dependent enzyme [Ensifer sp. ENS05]|uniref:aminotransferase class I/II-fold pyridoxal phosphate-dependent enzyme n=1 Tax=Ensifer sp. ENS05 TaxID=2769277 RepID=UPI0017808BEB|nr:aminotransferase class I/II-fold pyridoxal phosphate-dependent enzyme [Ensifer sp. ENS05]MBD9596379.1 aminotransferase class I/II-fold pyridoxal phosphate-dependent enzyme [Ensifer sp. ENS05]